MGCLPEYRQWVCIHTSNSLFEANLLRSFLENQGIAVSICAPSPELRDYLHTKEQIRIFIPLEDLEKGQRSTRRLLHIRQPKTPSS